VTMGSRALVVLLGALGSPLAAQQPVGPEFPVNTSIVGYQGQAAVGGNASGGFVVAWVGGNYPDQDIFARRFDGAGAPIGGEFRVNSNTIGVQNAPAVAVNPAGGFVVIWASYQATHQIVGQRYGSSGAPLGGEFRVDTIPYNSFYPRVAFDSAGNFIVVWNLNFVSQVIYQRFNGAGAPLGTQVTVNSTVARAPDVAPLASGGFVVTWNANGNTVPQYEYARRFDSSGNPLDDEFKVSSMTAATGLFTSPPRPRVASDPSGNFAIAWMADSSAGGDVSARRYAAAGAPFGSDFQVDLDPSPEASGLPQVGAGADSGGFLVAWARNRGGGDVDIRARHLPGGEIRVNAYTTGIQRSPAVAALAPGQFVVVWQSNGQDGDNYGVFGQRVRFPLTGDVDGNGVLNVNDVFYLINFLFAGGPPPVVPEPAPEASDL
jgi:hypothetical protein